MVINMLSMLTLANAMWFLQIVYSSLPFEVLNFAIETLYSHPALSRSVYKPYRVFQIFVTQYYQNLYENTSH